MFVRREFYYQDDKSNKFWTVEVAGNTVITTNGRIGSKPRETRKEYPTEAIAQRERDKLVAAKLRSGYIEGAIAAAPNYAKPDWAGMVMSEDVFWRILGLFNWKKLGNDEAVIEPAVVALAQMTIDNIERFADILAEKLHALDTEAHAREIGEDAYKDGRHFSVDWFLYARCVPVANGCEIYRSILADPTKDCEFEALLSVAPEAYERKTGLEFEYITPLSYETFTNTAGWPRFGETAAGDFQ